MYFYLFSIVSLWLLLILAGDLWWPATLFLFAPRWLLLLPLSILLPLAVWKNGRMILPLLAGFLIVIGPLMGLSLPIGKAKPANGHVFRVISCNLQNGNFELSALNLLIEKNRPDLIALQEFPASQNIKALEGWNHIYEGDLHIFSRFPVINGAFRTASVPQHLWPRTCFLTCTVKSPAGNLTFATVHLPSPRYGLQSILDRTKLLDLSRKNLLIEETANRRKMSKEIAENFALLSTPKIIAGDFNMPVESSIYRAYWSEYQNAFSKRGTGYGWTQHASVQRIPVAVRIDHILVDNGGRAMICETGPDVGSDHLPVIADIELH